jgi:hypothetical protein
MQTGNRTLAWTPTSLRIATTRPQATFVEESPFDDPDLLAANVHRTPPATSMTRRRNDNSGIDQDNHQDPFYLAGPSTDGPAAQHTTGVTDAW